VLASAHLCTFAAGGWNKQRVCGFHAAGGDIGIARMDGAANLGISRFKIIFQFVGIQNAGDRDAVFFQDEIFLIEVRD
jgi:hypothetical protein